MTDREIIKTELGRLKTELIEEGNNTMFEQGRISAFEDMEVFINSMQEESVSKDLNEEIARWTKEHFKRDMSKYSGMYLKNDSLLEFARHFAKWQKQQDAEYLVTHARCIDESYKKGIKFGKVEMKQQMMKDAIEQDVDSIWANPINTLERLGLHNLKGKVKLIIIKQEE